MKRLTCFICHSPSSAPAGYPNAVCKSCDNKATTSEGAKPWHSSDRLIDPGKPATYRRFDPVTGKTVRVVNLDIMGDDGSNPVTIGGIQCWRRYKFGGWITMADPHNCTTLDEFYELHSWNNPLDALWTKLQGMSRDDISKILATASQPSRPADGLPTDHGAGQRGKRGNQP